MEKKLIDIGRKAKEFTLKDQNGQDFRISEQGGKKILLSFHPLAWTSVCAEQMKSLERHLKSFNKLNTIAVGISVDSVPCKAAWAKSLRIKSTRLLCDFWPHGDCAKKFGILRKEGFSERANIILDEKGKVIFTKIYPIREVPDIKAVLDFLEG